MSRFLLPILVVILATALAYFTNATQVFGAHPFWAKNVLLIGAPIGLILGLALSPLPYAVRFAVSLGAAILSFVAANWGKTQFAASYADDAFAGQIWYFGWFSICICSAAFLATATSRKK